MAGECQSKCDHIARVPLRPDVAQKLHALFLSKGALASAAIEGNTLSEEQVLQDAEGKLALPPSQEYLKQEVDNIRATCNSITAAVSRREIPPLSVTTIRSINARVLQGLALEEGVVPGEFRRYSVGVEKVRYRGAPWEDCEFLIQSLCDWLNGPVFQPPPGFEIVYAFIKAIIAHVYLAWIHPFGDGNGRTARMVEFLILISSGVPSPAAHLLSDHYNQTRSEYYRRLDSSSKNGGDLFPFLLYAVQGFRDGLKNQLDRIFEQQMDVTWKSYVYNRLPGNAPGQERRRFLAWDVAQSSEPVPQARVTEISTRVARAYGAVTAMTLSRDLALLVNLGLVEKEKAGYKACIEKLREFMPLTAGRASPPKD